MSICLSLGRLFFSLSLCISLCFSLCLSSLFLSNCPSASLVVFLSLLFITSYSLSTSLTLPQMRSFSLSISLCLSVCLLVVSLSLRHCICLRSPLILCLPLAFSIAPSDVFSLFLSLCLFLFFSSYLSFSVSLPFCLSISANLSTYLRGLHTL